ncbi:hypothetical protein ACMFMG_011264 [Clarireedia jacksonii]
MNFLSEVAILHLSQPPDSPSQGSTGMQIIYDYLNFASKANGFRVSYHGRAVEDPKVFILIVVWDTVEDYHISKQTPMYCDEQGVILSYGFNYYHERLNRLLNVYKRSTSVTTYFTPSTYPEAVLSQISEVGFFYFPESIHTQGAKLGAAMETLVAAMAAVGAGGTLTGFSRASCPSPFMAFPSPTNVLVVLVGCGNTNPHLRVFDDTAFFALNRESLQAFEDVQFVTVYRTFLSKSERLMSSIE